MRVELPERSTLLQWLLLGAVGLVAVFVEAAPLGLAPGSFPSPDLLACAVAAVAARRPDAAAIPLVFGLGLLRDLVTDVPPGAGALGLVLLAEAVRGRSEFFRRRAFPTEWASVAAAILAMLALQVVLVLLTLSQPPYLMELVRQWALSAAVYPFVVVTLRWGLGVRWRTAGGGQTGSSGG